MKIAIPTTNNKLCTNISNCESLTVIIANNNIIESEEQIEIPFFHINNYPEWLIKLKIDTIITGKINAEFSNLLHKYKIHAITGAPKANPRMLVEFYTM